MTLKERFLRHRKDTRYILGMLGLLLILLSSLYYLLLNSRDLPETLVTNRVLLFVLWYIDVVLILAVLFVLARSLFKLLIERRHRILGSKFKSKLVATYIGLSLIPVLVLFLYATQLMQQSIDRWFTAPVREVLQQGSNVAQAMLRRTEDHTLGDARAIAADLAEADLDEAANRPRLDRQLQAALRREGLDYLAVYRGRLFLHGVLDPGQGATALPDLEPALLVQAALDGEATKIMGPTDGGRLIVGAVALPGTAPNEDRFVVVAARRLDPSIAEQSEQLIQAYQGYRQLELQRGELTASQLLLFLMITLLILLASAWVGLYLARRITVPIQALAEGTRIISGGDLSYRVDVAADDELGVLVESFNRMTGALQRGNQRLELANQRLDAERALLEAVLTNVAAGVLAVDAEGRVVLTNDAARQMLGQTEEELHGRLLAESWSDPERRKILPRLEPRSSPWTPGQDEVRLVIGGQWRTFEVTATAMHAGGDEALIGKVIVLEDLTELIKAQRVAAWSDAARRIAHEIKNPLTPIQLAAERMLHKHQLDPDEVGEVLEDGVKVIVREVATLKGMVDEFSRFARMPSLKPTELDLDALLQETIKLYAGLKAGVEVTAEVKPGAERAWADPEQLKGALINLLDNALEATEGPGSVMVTAAAANGTLRLRVADSGRGIPPKAKPKLFLPHFSTKGRGTGLGLAIVHRIVSEHQGSIRVEDNHPQGTVFTVELPLR